MITFMDLWVVVGMFALRIGVPLLVIFGLAYLLKRLDRRWEAEARLQAAQRQAQQPAVQPKPARRPATGVDVPGPQLPFDPSRRPIPLMAAGQQHCWDVKSCSEAQRATCVASASPDLPCWQARFGAEGRLPSACLDCEMFEIQPGM